MNLILFLLPASILRFWNEENRYPLATTNTPQSDMAGIRGEEDDVNEGLPKLETTPESTTTSTTFVMRNEDHTLGNALRIVISRNPNVTFCGYSVPHPLESKMHLHIQTKGEEEDETLLPGLKEIMSMCDHLGDVFDEAESEYYISSGR
ncbi:DNA-directed RNA polymerase subunit [Guillardia theta CCMP2712]|uniref:DNA-directed RNA polymerase subunit n=1 Tax=Guillardia theta (strain CCMP2712) TaxID=905079 RepID=L1JI33_GUITC|nr:DNA-directed RNA polymerase subunit [Guillardia theta CCMP2712]EKX48188.1 DNA-directed RNA polymerase subunit [Guillardia theta CCMP2712]|eukprot:XP_005835168.1 DNA-directed RNA polymerase subunit [Guillardia theta CCMP2712]